MRIESKCLYGDGKKTEESEHGYHPVSYPIYQTAMFEHAAFGEKSPYEYTRLTNPTRSQLEDVVCSLECGCDAIAFSSGISAIAAFMELFQPEDHVIAGCDLYGGSIRLFQKISQKNGIRFDFVQTDLTEMESFIHSGTKAIYIETPTNPMMGIADIEAIAKLAHKHGLILAVDNTFLSPYFQNPILLGADVVIHSGTKFLGGHNDTIAGFLVSGTQALAEKLRNVYKITGSALAPFDSWLILRGIKTLSVRMDRQQENAKQIAEWLMKQPTVVKVFYPGIKDSPGYEISLRQSRGFGSMITFETDSDERAVQLLERVQLIHFAESLGGVESLITYPKTQTHAEMTEEERLRNGITGRIVRMSVGIENVADIISDLDQALNDVRTIESRGE